jgi:hypothetical protein
MNILLKLIVLIDLISKIQFGYTQDCNTEDEVPSSTPNSRFTDNNDGTISDNGTGLMWHKCAVGYSGEYCQIGGPITYFTWQQAFEEAEASTLSGYNWRLPNLKELQSIVEQRCYSPSINTTYFPNILNSGGYNWSSTPTHDRPFTAWRVSFIDGFVTYQNRSQELGVRLVRFLK